MSNEPKRSFSYATLVIGHSVRMVIASLFGCLFVIGAQWAGVTNPGWLNTAMLYAILHTVIELQQRADIKDHP